MPTPKQVIDEAVITAMPNHKYKDAFIIAFQKQRLPLSGFWYTTKVMNCGDRAQLGWQGDTWVTRYMDAQGNDVTDKWN